MRTLWVMLYYDEIEQITQECTENSETSSHLF